METNYAVRPGEYLQEFLEDKGMDVSTFALISGLDKDTILDVLSDDPAPMSMLTAEGLSRGMHVAPRHWMQLERQYRKDKKRLETREGE